MTTQKNKIISIENDTINGEQLTPAQKKFNTLIKKISTKKQSLLSWQEGMEYCKKQTVDILTPLYKERDEYHAKLIVLLDEAYMDKRFSKKEKNVIKESIVSLAASLIDGEDTEHLKTIHDKYSDISYDESKEAEEDLMFNMLKSMVSNMAGVDIDREDIDFNDINKTRELLEKKASLFKEQQEEEQRVKEQEKSKRKKTPKQLEKEERLKQEEKNLNKSIQDVYRKLVADLHPDREPDEVERERKTKLMKRVNVAYENQNLLDLLELQLEIEQIDKEHLAKISQERLQYFNKILKNQLDEIEQGIYFVRFQIGAIFEDNFHFISTPQQMKAKLHRDIEEVREEVKNLKIDVSNIGRDRMVLKEML